jgi:hypothetical protein
LALIPDCHAGEVARFLNLLAKSMDANLYLKANEKTYSFNNAERALGGRFGWLFLNTCQIAGAI